MDTEKHAFLLRCNPTKGDYNFYCYCYVKEWLDKHMAKAEQGIRFIDPHYKEKFRIPDGGKIIITYDWGEKAEKTCRLLTSTIPKWAATSTTSASLPSVWRGTDTQAYEHKSEKKQTKENMNRNTKAGKESCFLCIGGSRAMVDGLTIPERKDGRVIYENLRIRKKNTAKDEWRKITLCRKEKEYER